MKIAAFGEVMLRLTPPDYYLLEQTNTLQTAYVGTGVNILANLAHFGLAAALITNLPDNRLGDAAQANLRKLGINDRWVGRHGQHLGSFFVELGFGPRPSQVTYQNRHHSSFGISAASEYPFAELVAEHDLIHICGIALSLTNATRDSALTLAKEAHQQGKKICFDFNYRPSLNTEHDTAFMKEQYLKILPYCDIVFGSQRDLTDLLELPLDAKLTPEEQFKKVVHDFMDTYQIDVFAGTYRKNSGDENTLAGFIFQGENYQVAPAQTIINFDRIGAGDAYAAGVLLGLSEEWSPEQTVAFATTNAILAHTIPDDVPLTTRKQVELVMNHPGIDLIR